MAQYLLFKVDELDQVTELGRVGITTEESECEKQKYFAHLDDLRWQQKRQEHLDTFDDSPEAMRRKRRREKQRQKWNAFCDALRPVDGLNPIPSHEAMKQFPDTDEVMYYRSRYYHEQVKKRNQAVMDRLQAHKRKIGFFNGKQYHFVRHSD